MKFIPKECVQEFTDLVFASTIAHRLAWIDLAIRARDASEKRSLLITARNLARAEATHADIDAAIGLVMGAIDPGAYGAAKVVQQRIDVAVRRGELSSTLGGTNEPTLNQLRAGLERISQTQCSSPVLGAHPASSTSTYPSA